MTSSPPPPPLFPLHSPPSSPRVVYTPDSEASFDRFSTAYSSDRYSDASSHRTQPLRPRIETREPPFVRAPSPPRRVPLRDINTSLPNMAATTNRDYLLFVYNQQGTSWGEEPLIHDIPASQTEIKEKAQSKNKNGSAMQQLQKMGPNRRAVIEKHVQLLNDHEADGSTWEPVFIDNTKMMRKGNTKIVDIKTFEVIFARKRSQAKRYSFGAVPDRLQRQSFVEGMSTTRDNEAATEKVKERRATKPARPVPSGTIVDDPFGETQWFDMTGAATGAAGGGRNSGLTSLPPFIPPEKPIGAPRPRVITGLDPDEDEGLRPLKIPGAYDDNPLSLGLSPGPYEDHHGAKGVIAIRDEFDGDRRARAPGRDHPRRRSSLSRSQSRRRGGLRQRPDSRAQSVRFSGHFDTGMNLPHSDRSSMASGDVLIFDSGEEMSSHTSEDPGSPRGPKIYRPAPSAYRQHRPGPIQTESRRPDSSGSGNVNVIMPERSRRRPSRAGEGPAMQNPYGLDQPLRRRNTSPVPKPTIHQQDHLARTVTIDPYSIQHPYGIEEPMSAGLDSSRRKPAIHQHDPPADVPPIAVYPQYFESREPARHHERDDEQEAHDYMKQSARLRQLREQEEELAQRQQALHEREMQAHLEEERRQRENAQLREQLENMRLRSETSSRRGVYTHEPRNMNMYNGRPF